MVRALPPPVDAALCACAECKERYESARRFDLPAYDEFVTAAYVCEHMLHCNRHDLNRLVDGDPVTGHGRSMHLWLAREQRGNCIWFRVSGVVRHMHHERPNAAFPALRTHRSEHAARMRAARRIERSIERRTG